jgi:hypothetical protein
MRVIAAAVIYFPAWECTGSGDARGWSDLPSFSCWAAAGAWFVRCDDHILTIKMAVVNAARAVSASIGGARRTLCATEWRPRASSFCRTLHERMLPENQAIDDEVDARLIRRRTRGEDSSKAAFGQACSSEDQAIVGLGFGAATIP